MIDEHPKGTCYADTDNFFCNVAALEAHHMTSSSRYKEFKNLTGTRVSYFGTTERGWPIRTV